MSLRKTIKKEISRLLKEEVSPRLNQEQIDELRTELVNDGVPVRFLYNGQALDIISGELSPKGSNVMHHPVYWKFTMDTAKKIAGWLGVKAVFSE